eukprot:365498-Chlamydomonas_euryale.AAC.6
MDALRHGCCPLFVCDLSREHACSHVSHNENKCSLPVIGASSSAEQENFEGGGPMNLRDPFRTQCHCDWSVTAGPRAPSRRDVNVCDSDDVDAKRTPTRSSCEADRWQREPVARLMVGTPQRAPLPMLC